MSSTVSEWYEGKRIFVTGATGSLGRVLVEKLLRSTNVEKIYVLIRRKRDQAPEDRLKAFVSIPLFDKLRERHMKIFDKLICVTGDVQENNLGIDKITLKHIKENVDVVFHVAANVKFQEPLKRVTLINLGGSLNMLEVAKEIKKLSVYVHVSTSYCHVNEEVLKEQMYPAPHNPRNILDLMRWLKEDAAESLTPHLIQGYPNTYAYTKCLTESLIGEYTSDMRIAIVRPSIVTATYSEPFPGWIDNMNGITGFMLAQSRGMLKTVLCNPSLNADLVPLDITINRMLVIAKKLSDNPVDVNQPLVVNLTTDTSNPITWEEVFTISKKYALQYPHGVIMRYPHATLRTSVFWHTIAVIFLHVLPAYAGDFGLRLIFVRPFLVKAQKIASKALNILHYYTTKKWVFEHKKINEMYSELSETDRQIFNCDISSIDWNGYFRDYVLGIRRYVMNENPATIPRARIFLNGVYVLEWMAKITLFLLCLWMILSYVIPV